MIPYNPLGIADSFPYFCEALVEFKDSPPELEKLFQSLILTYKQCLGQEEWNHYIDSFPPTLKLEFNNRFGMLIKQ
jgi:transportin-1